MPVPHHTSDLNIKIVYLQLKTRQLVWVFGKFYNCVLTIQIPNHITVKSEIRAHITADSSV